MLSHFGSLLLKSQFPHYLKSEDQREQGKFSIMPMTRNEIFFFLEGTQISHFFSKVSRDNCPLHDELKLFCPMQFYL